MTCALSVLAGLLIGGFAVHYYLAVDAVTRPMTVREDQTPYGERNQ